MNAKTELIEILYGKSNTLCAEVKTENNVFSLKQNYTEEEWNNFMSQLDFHYNNSSGNQIVHGTVWLQDGSWLIRSWKVLSFRSIEYWDYYHHPEIATHLK